VAFEYINFSVNRTFQGPFKFTCAFADVFAYAIMPVFASGPAVAVYSWVSGTDVNTVRTVTCRGDLVWPILITRDETVFRFVDGVKLSRFSFYQKCKRKKNSKRGEIHRDFRRFIKVDD